MNNPAPGSTVTIVCADGTRATGEVLSVDCGELSMLLRSSQAVSEVRRRFDEIVALTPSGL